MGWLAGLSGINLSGGQRSRISLARACYSDRDVIVLDDPLSAVDAHVARHLWNHLITNEWSHKTILMTTNQLSFLREPRVSRIVVLEGGRVVQQGTFNELMAVADGPFARLAASLHFHDKEEEDHYQQEDVSHVKRKMVRVDGEWLVPWGLPLMFSWLL